MEQREKERRGTEQRGKEQWGMDQREKELRGTEQRGRSNRDRKNGSAPFPLPYGRSLAMQVGGDDTVGLILSLF